MGFFIAVALLALGVGALFSSFGWVQDLDHWAYTSRAGRFLPGRRGYLSSLASRRGVGVVPPELTNGFAVASLVLGIVWVFWLGSALAVVFGHVARGRAKRWGIDRGVGMANAGLLLGYGGLAVLAVLLATGGSLQVELRV